MSWPRNKLSFNSAATAATTFGIWNAASYMSIEYTQRYDTYEINARVRDMNVNGVLGSMCFPSFPGFGGRMFHAGGAAGDDSALPVLQAYNDWHVDEWCGTHPGRFIPLAVPTIWDPETLAGEIHRVAKKGCHAVTFPENPEPLGLPSLHSDHWDPFWAACADEGTIV